MGETKMMYSCDLCGMSVQLGPHKYTGRHIARYNMTVCDSCWNGNLDGWGPMAEEKFKAHLAKHNIQLPEPNTKGWYPRS